MYNPPTPHRWTVADALEAYSIRTWGAGYYGINERGYVSVKPAAIAGGNVDLKELVDEVRRRGIGLPLLIRFTDILRDRVIHLNEAFKKAITEHIYKATYRGVYPIKVNQHRYVGESIVETGKQYSFGLEAGSKPELLAVLVLVGGREAPLHLNCHNDHEELT